MTRIDARTTAWGAALNFTLSRDTDNTMLVADSVPQAVKGDATNLVRLFGMKEVVLTVEDKPLFQHSTSGKQKAQWKRETRGRR